MTLPWLIFWLLLFTALGGFIGWQVRAGIAERAEWRREERAEAHRDPARQVANMTHTVDAGWWDEPRHPCCEGLGLGCRHGGVA